MRPAPHCRLRHDAARADCACCCVIRVCAWCGDRSCEVGAAPLECRRLARVAVWGGDGPRRIRQPAVIGSRVAFVLCVDGPRYRRMTTMPSRRYLDLTGQRFGRLVAVSLAGKYRGQALWNCKCDCGASKAVSAGNLRRGLTNSCGCLRLEIASRVARETGHNNRTHGISRTKLYRTWQMMMKRCYSERHNKYADYGGRGIVVCDEWRASVEVFAADMGDPTSPDHELDRLNNDGPYAKWNCKWSTRSEQLNNTRVNRKLTLHGRTQTATEWARELGINRNSLQGRLRLGWTDEDALLKPFAMRR